MKPNMREHRTERHGAKELDRYARKKYQDDQMKDEAMKRLLQLECEVSVFMQRRLMTPRPRS